MLTSTPLRPVCSPPGKQRNVNPAKATPAAGLRAHQGMERAPCTGTLASARRTRLGRAVWAAAAGVTAGPRSLGFVRPHPEMHAATSDAPAQMNSTAPHSRREMYLDMASVARTSRRFCCPRSLALSPSLHPDRRRRKESAAVVQRAVMLSSSTAHRVAANHAAR
jgi:hypothetical protein